MQRGDKNTKPSNIRLPMLRLSLGRPARPLLSLQTLADCAVRSFQKREDERAGTPARAATRQSL